MHPRLSRIRSETPVSDSRGTRARWTGVRQRTAGRKNRQDAVFRPVDRNAPFKGPPAADAETAPGLFLFPAPLRPAAPAEAPRRAGPPIRPGGYRGHIYAFCLHRAHSSLHTAIICGREGKLALPSGAERFNLQIAGRQRDYPFPRAAIVLWIDAPIRAQVSVTASFRAFSEKVLTLSGSRTNFSTSPISHSF